MEAFVEMFESLGYKECKEDIRLAVSSEPKFEKVVIYYTLLGNPDVLRFSPTHAALQIENGLWKSKIGEHEDIEHANVDCLNGEDVTGVTLPYGQPVKVLKRRRGVLWDLIRALYRVMHHLKGQLQR